MAPARRTYEQRWKLLRKWLHMEADANRDAMHMESCSGFKDSAHRMAGRLAQTSDTQHEMARLSRPLPRKETRR